MGFPPGMQLATIAFGIPLTATGKDVVTTVSVKPTARVIWAATGQPLPEFSDSFTAAAGQLGSFQVPFVNQAGFIDSTGATVTDFAYQVTASWEYGNERPITWSKNLKPLVGQTGTIDLDLVPDGPVSIPVTAPTAAVLGFGGRTGFITLQESDLPTRLSVGELSATFGPAAVGVAAWAASTAYVAGNVVRNPSGHVVTVITAHTSASTYDATKFTTPLGYMPLGGTPGIVTLKQVGDTRPGVWEMIHDSPTGYLFHLMGGVNAGSGAALIGLGGDNAATCLFVNNKKTGKGISIQQNDTITSATAYGFYASQLSTVAPLMHIDQADGTKQSVRIVTSETVNDYAEVMQIITPGAGGGYIAAKSGQIRWKSDIRAYEGGRLVARQSAANADDGNGVFVGKDNVRLTTWNGGAGGYWQKRISQDGQSISIELADGTSGGPDTAPATWFKAIEAKQVNGAATGTQLGFFGAAPVARAAAIATPTAPSATYVQAEAQAMKTTVDAIRAALTGIGITL